MLLHGDLFVEIVEAQGLRNVGKCICCRALPSPYVKAYIGKGTLMKTVNVENTTSPMWNARFATPMAYDYDEIVFKVKHVSKTMGEVDVKIERIVREKSIDQWFPLSSEHVKRSKGKLHLVIKFKPIHEVDFVDREVPFCYFPLRKGNRVRMYHDAVMAPGLLPAATLANGDTFHEQSCWLDLYESICNAKKFIYITGWSIWVHTVLVRRPYDPNSSLGELLKKKADEGVHVLMLVWDDATSTAMMGNTGMMGTRDEETRNFFSNSKVVCRVVARATDEKTVFVKRFYTSSVYTHHQKSVILDCEYGDGKLRAAAYVGGIDLTTGRYDTAHHPLFATLQEPEHKDDFYNACIAGVTQEAGPREPWHDIHGRVEGPVALDVMQNFEERWEKECNDAVGYLVDLAELGVVREEDSHVEPEDSPNSWNCQYFRSIDERSALLRLRGAASKDSLYRKKGRSIEMSIQRAYVQKIRSAQKFLYIENQYFLGSSTEWVKTRYKGSLESMDGAVHVIPMEITLKVCAKIRAGEHFCAYIVVPLYPEGIPDSGSVQEVLCWQRETFQMMYHHINKELKANHSKHPGKKVTDFLSVFCLGQRTEPSEKGLQDEVAKWGRQMIYVHSKMMIVDDEYIIIGSANINQRSMDGGRDTEMAFGGYQVGHTIDAANGAELPRGEVYGFRMSLFAEHMGFQMAPFMERPHTVETMREMRRIGEQNWKTYCAPNVKTIQSHLMNYPYSIDDTDGVLTADPLNPKFPGTNASVLGQDKILMPDSATM